jgi:membrane glycosyltransferase
MQANTEMLERRFALMTGTDAPKPIQPPELLARRRLFAAALNLGLSLLILAWLSSLLGAPHWTLLRALLLLFYAIALPWHVLGLANAAIGLWLVHGRGDALLQVAPFALDPRDNPLRERTALLMCLRDEDPRRAVTRLRAMAEELETTRDGASFDFFILSDSARSQIAVQEETAVAAWRREAARPGAIFYRRRADNAGFKAGNILDFCVRWGAGYTFMIPLDADSLMTAESLVRLARIGERNPQIGILQTLAVGAPSRSAFARIFQFGMRQGMRPYTMGAAWWAGDCGPFWGHNALVRIAPFALHCRLPDLPGGAKILSHDQVEAAFIRRAGYETRILPIEGGSFEENPPTLLDFIQRENRWCRGNLQYVHLLNTPGLRPMSRFQLVWAMAMFAGAPASTLFLALAALLPLVEDVSGFAAAPALAFYAAHLLLSLSPKLIGLLDVALTSGGVKTYGGWTRFIAGALVEIPASFFIGAAAGFAISMQILALPFGAGSFWGVQNRDARQLTLGDAVRALWPQTLFGLALLAALLAGAPVLALWTLPLWIGYVAAIPFASLTSRPGLGAAFAKAGLCATPEEFAPPDLFARAGGAGACCDAAVCYDAAEESPGAGALR